MIESKRPLTKRESEIFVEFCNLASAYDGFVRAWTLWPKSGPVFNAKRSALRRIAEKGWIEAGTEYMTYRRNTSPA